MYGEEEVGDYDVDGVDGDDGGLLDGQEYGDEDDDGLDDDGVDEDDDGMLFDSDIDDVGPAGGL